MEVRQVRQGGVERGKEEQGGAGRIEGGQWKCGRWGSYGANGKRGTLRPFASVLSLRPVCTTAPPS